MSDPFIYPEYLGRGKFSKKYSKNNHQGKEWEDPYGDSGTFRPPTVLPLFDYRKLKWVYFFVLFIFFVLFFRLSYLQVVAGKNLREAAEKNRFRINVLRAPRGIIYDRNKTPLVKNIPSYDLIVVPADLPREKLPREKEFETLKRIISLDDKEIRKNFDNLDLSSYEPVVLKNNLEREKALEILARESQFTGIKIEVNPLREYIYSEDFSHTLGYIGKLTKEEYDRLKKENNDEYLFSDWIGKDGLEANYENLLKGENGKEQVEVDSFGNVTKLVAKKPSVLGQNIITSLDFDLQKKVKETLLAGANNHGAAAIVLNPNNGEILSLVSFPSFNSNLFVKGFTEDQEKEIFQSELKPQVNRAIAGLYPPGSTVKPFIAAAALEEGIIDKNTTIEDKGLIEVPHEYNPEITYRFYGWKRDGLGPVNIFSAIAKSSDIYFYYVGGGYYGKNENFQGLGDGKLQQYYKIFGFGQKSGIDLPGELSGLIPNAQWKEKTKNEQWYRGDTYNISIGQGDILATPLQVAIETAIIANGGTLYKPHLFLKSINDNGNILNEAKPQIIREKFIRQANLDMVKEGMRQTVVDGSAKMLADLPIEIAGKTGTSEHGESEIPHAWFTAFAPYQNPEIVVTVLVEKGGEGTTTAVPIAKEILKWYFENK
ncbi:MAG: penicillin-binding protein 2 [Patescibacteria group bacterium]